MVVVTWWSGLSYSISRSEYMVHDVEHRTREQICVIGFTQFVYLWELRLLEEVAVLLQQHSERGNAEWRGRHGIRFQVTFARGELLFGPGRYSRCVLDLGKSRVALEVSHHVIRLHVLRPCNLRNGIDANLAEVLGGLHPRNGRDVEFSSINALSTMVLRLKF